MMPSTILHATRRALILGCAALALTAQTGTPVAVQSANITGTVTRQGDKIVLALTWAAPSSLPAVVTVQAGTGLARYADPSSAIGLDPTAVQITDTITVVADCVAGPTPGGPCAPRYSLYTSLP